MFHSVSLLSQAPLARGSRALPSVLFAILESFTCVLYDKTTTLTYVNEVRQELFSKKSKMMEHIPPTQVECFFHLYFYIYRCNGVFFYYLQAALLQRCNRALYQSSIWATSLQNQQNAPLPDRYGWQIMNSVWVQVWTLLPEVAKASRELLKCGCRAVPLCSRKCRCRKAGLPCTVYANVVENVTFLAKLEKCFPFSKTK